jgi:hypothetical protein
MLLELEDDALAEVLRAAKDAGVLISLTGASRQLCRLARSRLPVRLRVQDQQQADFIAHAAEYGMPFSGCVELHVTVMDLSSCGMATDILGAAQQWAALQRLQLSVFPDQRHWCGQDISLTDDVLCGLFQHLPALQQLQFLDLDVPYLHTSSAAALQPVTQVTSLKLTTRGSTRPRPDMSFLASWPNLVTLHLSGRQPIAPPPRAAAEQQAGPHSFPSSLVTLKLTDGVVNRGGLVSWTHHLAGCPQLQHLEVCWGNRYDAETHPTALLRQLAQHNKQLRSLTTSYGPNISEWNLPRGINPWCPDADLAGLRKLQRLSAGDLLHIRDPSDWQHAAQLTALTSLTGAQLYCAPDALLVGVSLAVLELGACWVHVGDMYALGRLLLACPLLERADLDLRCWYLTSRAAVAVGSGQAPLTAHPTLRELDVGPWHVYAHTASAAYTASAAATEFDILAPVLTGVTKLTIRGWPAAVAFPCPGPTRPSADPMPDLSPCSALVSLVFADGGATNNQQLCAMVAPAQQLESIVVKGTRQVNASVVVQLQDILPRLQRLQLTGCGGYELSGVQDQLRQGFELVVE